MAREKAERPPQVVAVWTRLAEIRHRQGLSQQDVANRMRRSRTWVCHIESARIDSRISTILEYSRAIGARLTAEVVDRTPVQPVDAKGLAFAVRTMAEQLSKIADEIALGQFDHLERQDLADTLARLSMQVRRSDLPNDIGADGSR